MSFDLQLVESLTPCLIAAGHKVFQFHRFADTESSHVARLERWAEFPRDAKVIDLGCGTGEVARLMAGFRPDISFTLVNISPVQLLYADKDMAAHCISFLNVPEDAAAFDGAMFCFSIGHEDLGESLKEAARLLKKNGVLFIQDMALCGGDARNLAALSYEVSDRAEMESKAESAGFRLDLYCEPQDDGRYGNEVLGKSFNDLTAGTIPAVWRFKKC
jgi:SAM-dependent methyltransferase